MQVYAENARVYIILSSATRIMDMAKLNQAFNESVCRAILKIKFKPHLFVLNIVTISFGIKSDTYDTILFLIYAPEQLC